MTVMMPVAWGMLAWNAIQDGCSPPRQPGLGGIQEVLGWEAVFLQSWALSAWVGIQEGPDPLM